MNIYAVAADNATSVHDLSVHTSASSFFYVIIAGLLGVIAWFIVRDRNDIATSLQGLREEFSLFRKDLAKYYATKHELEKVSDKIDRHIEHGIVRREMERRIIADAEGA